MRIVILGLALVCLGCFSWARRRFFVRTSETRRGRGGLGPLGTLFGVAVLADLALSRATAGSKIDALSILFLLAALWVFWLSVRAFGESRPLIAFTSRAPENLVMSGPYRWVRHPFYSAYILFWLGAFLGRPSIVTGAAVLVMTWLYNKAATGEEESLLDSPAGDEYAAYKERTGKFFPKILNAK